MLIRVCTVSLSIDLSLQHLSLQGSTRLSKPLFHNGKTNCKVALFKTSETEIGKRRCLKYCCTLWVGAALLFLLSLPSLPSSSQYHRAELLRPSSVRAFALTPGQAERPPQAPPHISCLGLTERDHTK